jgi:hypothetical protein
LHELVSEVTLYPRLNELATGGWEKIRFKNASCAGLLFHRLRFRWVEDLIFRTTWVYAHEGTNFLITILRLATQPEESRIVRDQIDARTWSRAIAVGTSHAFPQFARLEERSDVTLIAYGALKALANNVE